METMTLRQLREQLDAHGIRVSQFAAEAGMPQSKMSAILRGYEGLGPVRRARIEQAIVRLRLDCPPNAVPHSDPLDKPVLRVRRGG